jgi:Ca2+:H+ antiporter
MASHTRPSLNSPQPSSRATPKKPPLGKRTTSTGPKRGQEFSVDDDVNEVQQDKASSSSSSHALKPKASTLRRRPTAQAPQLPRVESDEREDDSPSRPETADANRQADSDDTEVTLRPEEEEEDSYSAKDRDEDDDDNDDDDDDDADLSDAESFTLKDRQEAINETHPFGIRIWKPALYKKSRSVQVTAEGDIHQTPGHHVNFGLLFFNLLWTLVFGWWLALLCAVGALVCFALRFTPGCQEYGYVLWQLADYIFYPFGKYVMLEHDEAYMDEDSGEGRSISEYERWQTGDLEEGRLFFGPTDINRSLIGRRRDSVETTPDETDSLLGRPGRRSSGDKQESKSRLFGRGKWTVGRIIFFAVFWGFITPSLWFISAICWFLVFTIPMGKVTLLLHHHLRRHPLALSFHSDTHDANRGANETPSSVLLCTYRAVGSRYWKYTIDGTNIFLINLLSMVAFAIFDFYILREYLEIETPITSSGFIFVLGLFSIIPLAYFIGQAVASISAQSSMGVGATINAFFSTVVEVFLYCVALNQGKAQLVEGSIIGSIFAGILFLPGISMCFGAIKRKTQRFNVRSAGVTSTMLLFAVIGSFSPTLFYQNYGSHELVCHQCAGRDTDGDRDCRRCYFNQVPALNDRFFLEAVRPYIWFAAFFLFLSYLIGLLFTLRTHAAVIWNNELDEKKLDKLEHQALHIEARHGSNPDTIIVNPHAHLSRNSTVGTIGTLSRGNIQESQLYKRILGQSLKQAGFGSTAPSEQHSPDKTTAPSLGGSTHIVPPKANEEDGDKIQQRKLRIPGLSAEDNTALVRQVAEMAATAATVAARDATHAPRKASQMARTSAGSVKHKNSVSSINRSAAATKSSATPDDAGEVHGEVHEAPAHEPGGHDAPNWSRTKSAVILLTATLAYAVIAEILVDTVDSVLEHIDIDEKFLGITLFALVPNTTEFLNAISFAMNGNIALSMEIGSAYALQVMLLQVPALVLYSGVWAQWMEPGDVAAHTFNLIFPQWDMVTIVLSVFLMGWVIGEGKSNYFKGSILILAYLTIIIGFWFSSWSSDKVCVFSLPL